MRLWDLLAYVPLLGGLAIAASIDLRTRRIPNILSLAILAGGLTWSLIPGTPLAPWQSLAGILAGAALLMLPFAIGALGGGDVKLLAAIGAWLGPLGALLALAAACLFGMLIVIVQGACQGRLRTLLSNSTLLALNVAHVQKLGTEHVSQTGAACRSVSRPLAFAVPLLLGTVVVLVGWALAHQT